MNLSGSGGTALTITAGAGTFNGTIIGATSSLNVTGGTQTLTNPANSYGGETTITGGALTVGAYSTSFGNVGVGTQLGSAAVSLGSGGVLNFTGPTSGTALTTSIVGLNSSGGNGTVNLTNEANLQIGTSSSSSTYSGAFTGLAGQSIAVTGGGTFTYSGTSASTFVSPITVSNGTLRVTGNSGGASITVGDLTTGYAATLSGPATGTGTIGGAVTVNGPLVNGGSGGTLVGASGGQLSFTAGLTLGTGSITSLTLGTPNNTSNALFATSTASGSSLSITGTNTIVFTTPQLGEYDLFSYTGASPNFSNLQLVPSWRRWRITVPIISCW